MCVYAGRWAGAAGAVLPAAAAAPQRPAAHAAPLLLRGVPLPRRLRRRPAASQRLAVRRRRGGGALPERPAGAGPRGVAREGQAWRVGWVGCGSQDLLLQKHLRHPNLLALCLGALETTKKHGPKLAASF